MKPKRMKPWIGWLAVYLDGTPHMYMDVPDIRRTRDHILRLDRVVRVEIREVPRKPRGRKKAK